MKSCNICVGDVFGRLTVVNMDDEKDTFGKPVVTCKCSCGNIVKIVKYKLVQTTKPVRSCGCLRLDRVHESKTIHGDSGGAIVGKRSRLYRIWSNIKSRCYNKNVRSYKDYGERGIKVCDEWLNSYEEFKLWAISNGYSDDLTIDRIDSDKDYCPNNCRWITASENSIRAHEVSCWGRNIETEEYVEFTNIREFAKEYGLSYSCIDRVLHHRNKTHKNWIFGYL